MGHRDEGGRRGVRACPDLCFASNLSLLLVTIYEVNKF